jgi:hypothetical protein
MSEEELPDRTSLHTLFAGVVHCLKQFVMRAQATLSKYLTGWLGYGLWMKLTYPERRVSFSTGAEQTGMVITFPEINSTLVREYAECVERQHTDGLSLKEALQDQMGKLESARAALFMPEKLHNVFMAMTAQSEDIKALLRWTQSHADFQTPLAMMSAEQLQHIKEPMQYLERCLVCTSQVALLGRWLPWYSLA